MSDPSQFNQREIAKTFRVPEYLLGLPSPWWRRRWQRFAWVWLPSIRERMSPRDE